MKQQPLISVIVPIYNSENYLTRCLDSLIAQTWSNIEIILVNDGSMDTSGNICDKYACEDERIKVIHQKNQGQAVARNRGLEIAKGEYVGFVDSDDWLHPQMYELLYESIFNEGGDIAECEYISTKFYQESNEIYSIGKETIFEKEEILKEYMMGSYMNQVVWNKLYRKSVINDTFIAGKHLEDIFWLYKILANCRKCIHISNALMYYFQREDSLSGQPYSLKKLEAVECADEMVSFIKSNHPQLQSIAETYRVQTGLYHYQILCKNKHIDPLEDNRKKIISICKKNETNFYKNISLKQKIWLKGFLTFPKLTCYIRNYLLIGI